MDRFQNPAKGCLKPYIYIVDSSGTKHRFQLVQDFFHIHCMGI